MKKYISIVALSVCFFYATAQQSEAVAELQKIKNYYSGPELKHVTGQMLLKNSVTGKQVDKVSFEYWAKDKKVMTKMNYIEILNNDEFYVMVNNKQKTIYAREQSAMPQKANGGFFDTEMLNQLLAVKGATITVTKGAGVSQLSMSGLQHTRFSSVVISYNPTDYKITSVNAVVSETPENKDKLTLEIKYTATEKTVVSAEPAVFSSGRFIEKNNKGNYSFTKTYQNYQKL